MNDLVRVLRGQRIDGRGADEIMRRAADEIERLRRELAEARGLLAKCRGEIAYQDGLLTQLCPVEGPMAKSPHPALAEIDAFLAGDQSAECDHTDAVRRLTADGTVAVHCPKCGRSITGKIGEPWDQSAG